MDDVKQKTSGEVESLKDFIDDHQRILTVIGVFIGLAVFFSKTELSSIGLFISFLALAATIPLLLQVYQDFRTVKPSWLLRVFANIFTPLIAYVCWYLVIAYRPFWKTQTANVLLWSTVIPLWYLLKRFHVQNAVARSVEEVLYVLNRLATRVGNAMSDRHIKKYLKNLDATPEEKNRRREMMAKTAEEFRHTQKLKDREQAARESQLPANILVGVALFVVCAVGTHYLSLPINKRLDKVYESYKAADVSPTPTTATPMPTPSASAATPISSPSPQITPAQ